jgi:hypothetical protein
VALAVQLYSETLSQQLVAWVVVLVLLVATTLQLEALLVEAMVQQVVALELRVELDHYKQVFTHKSQMRPMVVAAVVVVQQMEMAQVALALLEPLELVEMVEQTVLPRMLPQVMQREAVVLDMDMSLAMPLALVHQELFMY